MEPREPRVANETCSEITPFPLAERESIWETEHKAPQGNRWHPHEKRREFRMFPGTYGHRRLFVKPGSVGQLSPPVKISRASCQTETSVPGTQQGLGT